MRKASLRVREDLLEQAREVSGERTYSRTVERALEELVRRSQARKILELAHCGQWKGDLAEMRDDFRAREVGRGPG